MSSIYFESNSNLSVTGRDGRVTAPTEASVGPLGMPGLILGLALLGLGIVALLRLGDWAGSYGPELVVLAYVLYMGAAAWLALWGAGVVRSLHRH
ncbi:hypothetical protein ATM97_12775 [Nocardia sp. MH4]|jgi:protein-S-isoprenylcysteine O-methyltransferase Ste14|uniref:hypothetical protein n=1 Tax=Nocardia TaxID=1817 RepID=UPI001C4EE4CF|nr:MULTISPECIES: hypothetical protein [Nocardia]MBW0271626.1 hypothetical protein [Nocardia sp. MH4]